MSFNVTFIYIVKVYFIDNIIGGKIELIFIEYYIIEINLNLNLKC